MSETPVTVPAHSIHFSAPLSSAFERMKDVLFRPFEARKWFIMGFGAWLAHLGSGGGSNVGNSFSDTGSGNSGWDGFSGIEPWLIGLFVLLVVLVLVLIPLVIWLSSRGQFIFLDNTVRDRAEVKKPWAEYRREGNSLFLWQLVFIAAIILAVAAPIGLPFLFISGLDLEEFGALGCLVASLIGLLVLAVIVAAAYTQLFLTDFVVPIMRRHRLTTTEAWRVFLPVFRARRVSFLLYGIFILLLWIGIAIAMVVAIFATCCVAAIPLIIPYINAVLLLPIYMTFRFFSLEFLAQFSPELNFLEDQTVAEVFD